MVGKQVTLKTILAGDGGVGKTSLVKVFMREKFSSDYKITVGVDVSSKSIKIDKDTVIFSVNDVAGQERFEVMRSLFFKGAVLALLVFDLTRKESLTSLRKQWIAPLIETNPNGVHAILIGNKSDLEDLRVISEEDGNRFSELLSQAYPTLFLHDYIETSAKENVNVDECFTRLAEAYLSTLI